MEDVIQLCNAALDAYKTEGMEGKTCINHDTQTSTSRGMRGTGDSLILEKSIKLDLVSYSN